MVVELGREAPLIPMLPMLLYPAVPHLYRCCLVRCGRTGSDSRRGHPGRRGTPPRARGGRLAIVVDLHISYTVQYPDSAGAGQIDCGDPAFSRLCMSMHLVFHAAARGHTHGRYFAEH